MTLLIDLSRCVSLYPLSLSLDGLPCQFCNKLFPFDVFERHQRSCDDRFLPHNLERDNLFGTRGNRDTPISLDGVESNYETCPNCNESILTTGMYLHKVTNLYLVTSP